MAANAQIQTTHQARAEARDEARETTAGYRTFRLGELTFARDEYFVTVTWPAKGKRQSHTMSVDAFLRAMMRDVAWDFFYGIVNFDDVFGTRNHYGTVDLFAGRYNEAIHGAGLSYVETFDSAIAMARFKEILADWTNEGFDPFAAPAEAGHAVRREERRQPGGAIDRFASPPSAWSALPGDAPLRTDAQRLPGQPHVRRRRPGRARGARRAGLRGRGARVQPVRLSVPLRRDLEPVGGLGRAARSLYCPTTEEYILPIIHGNDRVEWFVQLSDEITWDVDDRETGRPRARLTMKAGDVAAMPADIRHQGFSPKRSMLLVWENATADLPSATSAGSSRPGRSSSAGRAEASFVPEAASIQNRLFIDGEFVDGLGRRVASTVHQPARRHRSSPRWPRRARTTSTAPSTRRARHSPPGSRMAAAERGRLLLKLADAIEAHADELAQLESLDTGHPLRDTRVLDVPRTAVTFRYFGGMADKLEGTVVPVEPGFLNYVAARAGRRGRADRPVELPADVHQLEAGPRAGRRQHRRCSSRRADAAVQPAGRRADPRGRLPARRGQHRARLRATAGQHLAEHPGVDKIAFTGSTATGGGSCRPSAGNLKRVQLELGGKGANIVFDDAVAAGGGQRLRLRHLPQPGPGLHRRLAAAAARDDRRRVPRRRSSRSRARIRLGDPLDPGTEMGPLTSAQHRDRVLGLREDRRRAGRARS